MDSRLDITIELLHAAVEATLATNALSMPGYPLATTVLFAPDEGHRPLFLMSALAEHARNLDADDRASLLVRGAGHGADTARVALIGRVGRCELAAAAVARFLRYRPEGEPLLQLGDFAFRRMAVERIRVIGGFGQAGWLEGRRLADALELPPAVSAAILGELERLAPADTVLLGVDGHGVDVRHGDERLRLRFARPAANTGEVREAAVAALGVLA